MNRFFLAFLFLALFFVSCSSQKEEKTIRMAQQFGMIYAPLYITTELGLLGKNLEGAKIKDSLGNTHKNPHVFLSQIQRHYFSNGETIIEALISGDLDVGCMGLSPALVAMDKGADFKIAFGISVSQAEVIAIDKNINSLNDIKPNDKIAIPSTNSIQQIVLSMAAKKLYGDPHKFDKNTISMKNPEGLIALLKNTDIKAHFAPLPFNAKELEAGARVIFDPDDINFDMSIVCVATNDFYNNQKDEYNALVKSIKQSIDLINKKDKKAINIISRIEKIKEKEALKYLDYDNMLFTMNIYDLDTLNDYMLENGYLKNSKEIDELAWDTNLIITDK